MKPICCVIPFLLALFPATLRAQQPAPACHLETSYDREADLTTVQCELLESVEAPGRLMIQAVASYQGKEPNETTKFRLGLSAYKGGATRRTPPFFKEATTLSLFVDSARLEIPVKDYRKDFFELNRLLAEQAGAAFNREDLQKVLAARSVVGRWGGAEFKFSDSALAALKNFIAHNVFSIGDR